MTELLVVSIDSSTTAVKAIAWNRHGQAIAEGRVQYPMLQPHPGWCEQDAGVWWATVCEALRTCTAQVDARRIEALGITHQRESFVPVDSDNRPLRNAILWIDERSSAQVDWLISTFGRDHLHEITGKPPSMNPSLPKLVWLQQNEPETLQRAHKVLDAHAFLVRHLTGQFRTSTASADPMGLLDMREQQWSDEILRGIDLRLDQLPELVRPGEIIGTVSEEASRTTGLRAGLPVVAGAGDGQCAGLGANATDNRVYLNLGSAVVSGAMSDTYLAERAFRTLNAPIAGTFYLEHVLKGGVFTVGWFVDRFASELRGKRPHQAEEALEAAAAAVSAGASGLMLVPYWNEVMNPYWDRRASGITIGWKGHHGRAHFYRALLEGVAYEQRLVGDAMMAARGRPFAEYVTMGGGSRSKLWCEIIATVTGIPVVRSTVTEATCLGAAVLAAVAAGWYSNARSAAAAMSNDAERIEPVAEWREQYESLYQRVYKPLFPTLQPLIHQLSALTDSALTDSAMTVSAP